jgi:uncharacterized membrane protein
VTPGDSAGAVEQGNIRVAKFVATGVLGLQAVALLWISTFQYSRFGLGIDFTTSNQAAFLIAHGHLNPYITTHRYPYLDDHFGLLLYPIALIYLIYPHGSVLLWLQDLAGVGAEIATIWWIAEIVVRRRGLQVARAVGWAGPALVIGAVVLLVADPWFYTACLFDFHLNAFAALFLVLAARDAWNGRITRAGVFAALLLLTGDTGGLYLAGLGLSVALAAKGRRRFGLIALVVGVAWVLVVHVLAVNQSHVLVASYTYLVTGSPLVPGSVTLFTVAKALIEHPHRWIQMLWGRRKIIYEVLIPTGVIGVASPWALGSDLVIFFLQAIALPLTFLVNGFDVMAGLMVGLAASVMMMAGLAYSPRRWTRMSAIVIGAGMLAQSIALASIKGPEIPPYWFQVSAPQAAALARGLDATPPNAEVISSWGVMGRFSNRQWIYPLYVGVEAEAVRVSTIIFVLTDAGNEDDPPATVAAIIEYVKDTLKARVIVDSDGINVFEWHPPKGATQVSIPSLSS